jgi:autotransporter-associated beta strand protein
MNDISSLKLIIIAQLLSGLGFSAFAAGGGVQYFDVNGASTGFGSPSATGLYDQAGTALATTTLATGFTSGVTVTSVVVASATGIVPGATMTGAGVPAGVLVTGVSGSTVSVSSFTSTAANNGSYAFGKPLSWTTSGVGIAATTAFVSGDTMAFGEVANDTSLQGTFTVALDAVGPGNVLGGITVNSTGVNVTLTGAAGVHPAASTIWTVNAGSVLTEDDTSVAPGGMNFNNEAVQLAGGGTITFSTPVGNNSNSAMWTQNMPGGGTVNFDWATPGTSTFGGSYKLQNGVLNFATAAACATAFGGFQPTSTFIIGSGTTIDNTSGTDAVLDVGTGSYNITGSFTFAGSSGLDFGSAPVSLNGNSASTITVNGNIFRIGGVISSPGGAGLTKAGVGNLVLNNTETYTGATTVSAGTLTLGSNGGLPASSNIIVENGATLDFSALASLTLNASQTLTAEGGTGFINGNLVMSAGSQFVEAAGTTLTVVGGVLTLNNNPITIAGDIVPLPANIYPLIASGSGGSVAGDVASSTVTVSGAGLAPGTTAHLQINGGSLQLLVAAQPPNLAISYVAPDSVVVSWPATGSYTLQQSANVADPGSWATSVYNNNITTANGTSSITIVPPTGNLFFRLKQ